ncbi:hypothetical protein H072_9042 [Dactylellina haptotyla CBS 200.50]|uniref:Uncharacterized protein n=1 Tax=Dactylellina haptotyla (strain CBS 200.50) TaxID=1284197 RepID=S8A853_DACHA|nr:hypothetical protein H072_9042 [Dactylellina haptotyla CBS 200.50]
MTRKQFVFLVWTVILLPNVLCDHRGYFILRVLSATGNPSSPFSKSRHIVISPSDPLSSVVISPVPVISPCPSKPTAIYDPEVIWLADWRIPQHVALNPSSTAVSSFSFFNRAKVAMNNVVTPLLRSLSDRSKTLAWGYLDGDVETVKEGRVSAIIVPDDAVSVTDIQGYGADVGFVELAGVGAAESVRFVYDPTDQEGGSPSLQPNLTPPKSGAWVVGTLDPSVPFGKAYFSACQAARGKSWHLFRNQIFKDIETERLFNLFYLKCEDVYIHAQRVSDGEICFRWDTSTQQDEQGLDSLGSQRLFTIYHNSLSSSYPQIITPEIDDVLITTTSKAVPGKGIYLPHSQEQNLQTAQQTRTISTINMIEDDMTGSFAEGLRDFINVGRDTPAFGSTDNSAGGSGYEAEASGSGTVYGSDRSRRSRSSEGLPGIEIPDEINLVPHAPDQLVREFEPRGQDVADSARGRSSSIVIEGSPIGRNRENNIQIEEFGSYPLVKQKQNANMTPNPLLSQLVNSRSQRHLSIPSVGRAGTLTPGIVDNMRVKHGSAYQPIPGINDLFPTIKGAKQSPGKKPLLNRYSFGAGASSPIIRSNNPGMPNTNRKPGRQSELYMTGKENAVVMTPYFDPRNSDRKKNSMRTVINQEDTYTPVGNPTDGRTVALPPIRNTRNGYPDIQGAARLKLNKDSIATVPKTKIEADP